jgi:fatty-acyl-CoA synthase
VVYSHRSTVLHTLIVGQGDICALRSTDVVLPAVPMFHANCWGIPYAAVMHGIKLVFPGPHLAAEDLLDLMQAEPPTLSLGVPTIWLGIVQQLDAASGRWRLPRGMRSLVGGAPVPESLIRAFARHGVHIIQGWGMTETSPISCISYPRAELRGAGEDEQFRRAALAGVPVPLVELRLQGEDGTLQPWDGRSMGEIQVRGPWVTGRYFNVPPGEDKFAAGGWLRTGDVATVDPLGFVRITDRTKDLVKSGGEWISSVDLENALMAHPAVAEAAVIAVPDEKWGERPLACVVLRAGCRSDAAEFAQHLIANGFAKWQLPDRYEFIDAVPRTSTGKFWKAKLRERFALETT